MNIPTFVRRAQRLAFKQALARLLCTIAATYLISWFVHPLLVAFVFFWCTGAVLVWYFEYCGYVHEYSQRRLWVLHTIR